MKCVLGVLGGCHRSLFAGDEMEPARRGSGSHPASPSKGVVGLGLGPKSAVMLGAIPSPGASCPGPVVAVPAPDCDP